jgi:hypothetical protein
VAGHRAPQKQRGGVVDDHHLQAPPKQLGGDRDDDVLLRTLLAKNDRLISALNHEVCEFGCLIVCALVWNRSLLSLSAIGCGLLTCFACISCGLNPSHDNSREEERERVRAREKKRRREERREKIEERREGEKRQKKLEDSTILTRQRTQAMVDNQPAEYEILQQEGDVVAQQAVRKLEQSR